MFAPLRAFLPLLAVAALAQDVRIPYEKFVLSNGLTVLVHEDHKAPIVAINIWYHVGSKDEKPGRTGFAHLFEHLMFGGSENAPGRYIDGMERIGATDLNGTTNPDRTNYFENVPVSALDYALFLESDRMGHFYKTINKETLDLQRGVVQNEKRQGENQPYAITEELITKATYPAGHPYSWTTIGSMEDLNAASLADVQQWFKSSYNPSNATLAIAGDIDVKTAREKVEKYFGDIPAGPPLAHQNVWIAKMTGTHTQQVQDRVPQARVYNVWNVPEYGSADADSLDLAARILSAGRSSRLYKRLVYDSQIATQVTAFVDENEIGSQFYLTVTAKPGGSLEPVNQAVREELDKFLRDGPSADELERAQTAFAAARIRGLERIGGFGGKSDILAHGQVFKGNPDLYRVQLDRVRNATAADIRDAARRWLSDGLYQLEVLPFTETKTLTTGIDRSKLPVVGAAPEAKLPVFQRATLSNGLKIVLAERHDLPLVDFEMVIDAGAVADRSVAPGASYMTAAMLTSGSGKLNTLELSERIQRLGAQVTTRSRLDADTVNLSALKSKLDESLALYADVLLHPTFPAEEVSRQQKLQIAGIQRELADPTLMAVRLFPQVLFGKDHPYGIPLTGTGTQESVSKMTRDDLVKFHETWFKPNNATLIIVGDTTLAEIRPRIENVFSSWKPGDVPKKTIPTAAAPTKSDVYMVDKPGAQQSFIMVGTIAPRRNAADEIALETWNNIFGGNFGSRMNMNLREDKHWSYGTQSFIMDTQSQRPYITMAPVQTDKTKESLMEMNKEFHDVTGSRPETQAELDKAKDNQTLELAGSRETRDSVMSAIYETQEFKLPDDYFSNYATKVRSLTTGSLNDAGKSFLNPDRLIWVVVGDRSKIEQGVRELNLGTLHVVDANGNPVQ